MKVEARFDPTLVCDECFAPGTHMLQLDDNNKLGLCTPCLENLRDAISDVLEGE